MVNKVDPRIKAAQMGRALHYRQSGNLKAAKAVYVAVLRQDPDNAEVLHLLACLHDDTGSTGQGIKLLVRATKLDPQAPAYHFNLANMLFKLGNEQDAIAHYREAIRLKPDYSAAYNNLGRALSVAGQRPEAKSCFESAIRFRPGYVDPHYNLGIELKAEGDFSGAVAAGLDAIGIKPGFADAHCNLGSAYLQMQRISDALKAFHVAAQLQPGNPKFQTNLGVAMLRLGRQQDAIAFFERALQLNPTDAQTRSNLILALSYVTADPAKLYEQVANWDRAHARPLGGTIRRHTNAPVPDRRLRIGYVSADFRCHAAAYWIEPLLAGSSHADFEVFCYSNSPLCDDATSRLKSYSDNWVDCAALNDDAMADRIRRDAIDILVDLSSHTDGHRLLVFARQPAPLQVSWFGFPISTGLSAIQYRFTDNVIDPEVGRDDFYSEKLIRLDRFYAAFQPDAAALVVGPGPASQENGLTFASLNSLAKVTRPMLDIWADILLEVPDSRLLIQSAGLEGADLAESVRSTFVQRGVSADRLILNGWTDMQGFLRLGEQVDIVLDPFPFNGGVTTCHALWMGLPVVTMCGESAASRVGASILRRIGLSDLVASDPSTYREAATALAKDAARLADLRTSLRARMASGGLLDGADLAAKAEAAYRERWRIWCAKT